MNLGDVKPRLTKLKMSAALEELESLARSPDFRQMTPFEILHQVLEAEDVYRTKKRFENNLKRSKIKYLTANSENIIFDNRRSLDRSTLLSLASCEWFKMHRNIIVTGLTGVGKTYIASWLGIEAVKKEIKVIFKRFHRLMEEIEQFLDEGEMPKYRASLARFKILIIDDFGLAEFSAPARQEFLEIIEDKADTGSIIVTTQMPVDRIKWVEYLGADKTADSIYDRLAGKREIIDIHGESMRRETKH
ncbi:ATP-binding protein [Kangiella sp. TOML190]|uniref:ATP-binding protein n=1 Tax=Kangiella sp. TOML190 TaxID=2931351 RepID=UPI00203CBDBE|nr:ATP-binding protein [Kangiella sp. TOML190]